MDHRMTQKEIDEALVLAMEADKREIERLRAELAASQAREKVLREALSLAVRQNSHDMLMTGEEIRQCEAALTLSADDTALRAALAQVQEEMRERCIEEVRVVGGIGAIEVERLIRALEVKP